MGVTAVVDGTVAVWVDGIPKAQPRPRAFARNVGGKAVARVYDAGTAEHWKAQVVAALEPHRPTEPLDEPVGIGMGFLLPRPKNRCRKKDPDGEIQCTSKPDCDNLAKAVLDAMTQVGWWRDDSLVVSLHVWKKWHAKDKGPGMQINLWRVRDEA